jgi:hypothetical protein
MRVLIALLIMALFVCRKAQAQLAPSATRVPQSQGTQNMPAELRVEDGGTRSMLESIVVPPKANAPFSLTLHTEWVKNLSDGSTITIVNQRRIARDTEGRIYQERWRLVPQNGKEESPMAAIQISDPVNHTYYNCFTLDARHQCGLFTYGPSTNTVFSFQGPPSGPLPDGQGESVHEDLGTQFVAGIQTLGTRDTVIYNAGVFGNERKMSVEREFWYAPNLGFNLLSKRSDPRIGTETFTATDLLLSDPDAKLFEPPQGFTVVDRRQSASPEN